MMARRLTPPDGGPGTSDHSLAHGGLQRAYRIHVPPVLPVGAPLVIQLHGGGGNGRGLDRLTRFHSLADRERFAVVSPDGFDRHWNDGRRPANPVDDVGFIAALIDCAAGWLPVDRRRVYVAGISNGAMMAARLADRLADRIAAFAQVAGTAAEDATQWWQPDRPVPFLQVHGTNDPILAFGGGALPGRLRGGADRDRRPDRVRDRVRDRSRVLGVDAWAALVAGHNQAAGPAYQALPPDVGVRRWRGATGQSDVEFWRVEGGGHTWPGGVQYLPASLIGTTTHTFDATAAIWRFFSAHALR